MATAQLQKERQLQRDVARLVEAAVPGVEVLALELTGKERFCVFVDHAQGVDHALCVRVTEALRDYLDSYSVEVSSPGFERHSERRSISGARLGEPCESRPRQAAHAAKSSPPERSTVQIENGNGPVEISYDEIVRANLIDEGTKG